MPFSSKSHLAFYKTHGPFLRDQRSTFNLILVGDFLDANQPDKKKTNPGKKKN